MALTKVRRGGTDTGISDSSDATAITIDSSENVGINSTSPSTYVDGSSGSTLVLESSGTNRGALVFASECTGGEGEILGLINFTDTANSSTNKRGAAIRGIRGSSDTNPFLTFTTANSERMRIDSSGRVMVGTTSSTIGGSSGTGNEGVVLGGALGNAIAVSNSGCLDLNRKSTNGTIIEFRFNGSSVGSISTNANSLPSDKNFKRDIKDLNIGLDLVSQLQPKSFNLIVDNENSPVMYGLIAQDLEIALEKVGVTKNSAWILQHEEKNDAKESDYSLDYSKLIPILINSVKELSAKNDALEARIKKLEDG